MEGQPTPALCTWAALTAPAPTQTQLPHVVSAKRGFISQMTTRMRACLQPRRHFAVRLGEEGIGIEGKDCEVNASSPYPKSCVGPTVGAGVCMGHMGGGGEGIQGGGKLCP